jgi:hypothetical protein
MRTVNLRRVAMLAATLLFAAEVAAQWAWKDDNGRLVFSDRPPPSSIKPEQLVRQPGTGSSQPALRTGDELPRDASKPDASKPDVSKAGPKTLAEREMEYRKRQTERAEAEKKSAEQQQLGTHGKGNTEATEPGSRTSTGKGRAGPHASV